MNHLGNGGFHVEISKSVAIQIRQLQRRAIARGDGKAFADAYKKIVRALRTQPRVTGEALYDLPSLRLQIRSVVAAPLAIHFGVSHAYPHVYIKRGVLLSG